VPVFRKEVYLEIQQERSGDNERQSERETVDEALHKLKSNK
jgi:sRNA-binding carbon storage regulator CsrA